MNISRDCKVHFAVGGISDVGQYCGLGKSVVISAGHLREGRGVESNSFELDSGEFKRLSSNITHVSCKVRGGGVK